MKTGVAVEKLLPAKFAKIKSRQEAPQSIFSGRVDIFYPLILAVWDEKRVFQQPRLVTTVTPNSPSLAGYLVGLAVAFVGFTACSNGISLPSASTQGMSNAASDDRKTKHGEV